MIREEQEKNEKAEKAIQDDVEMEHMPQLKEVLIFELKQWDCETRRLKFGNVIPRLSKGWVAPSPLNLE